MESTTNRRGFLARVATIVGGLAAVPALAGRARARTWRRYGFGPFGGNGYGGYPYGGYGLRRSAYRRFNRNSHLRFGVPYGAPYGGVPYGGIYGRGFYGAPAPYGAPYGGGFYGAPRGVYIPLSGPGRPARDALRLLES